MIEEVSSLNELKKEYEKLSDKYNLPEFSKLNEIFDIEEIDIDTEFLLRKIRRTISDKTTNYLRFIEIILNPSNAPMFFFRLINKLEDNDKTELGKAYELLGNLEIEIISLDLEYNEEKESEFIKRVYNIFVNQIKGILLDIVKKLSNGENKKKNRESSYCG